MGNSRSGGTPPPGPTNGGSSSSSTGTRDAGACTPRAPGGPAIPAPAASRSVSNGTVTGTPPLPSRGVPSPRSSGTGREKGSTAPGNVMRPCSDRQRNGASVASKNSPSGSLSRDSDWSAGSTKGAETPTSERAGNGNTGSLSSKKRKKRQTAGRYFKRFKPVGGANAAGVVVSPDRVGKENTSSGHVANSNVSKVQPRKPTDAPLQNIVAESSLPGNARNRPTAPARQSCLPSLQSVPISLVHHEAMKNTLGDSEPISVQKEDSASGPVKEMPSDETDGNPNICVACGTTGDLRSCDGKGCQIRYHISCLDPSLEYLSPGIWFCTSCTDKRFRFGLHSIVDGIESVWDVKEAEGMQNSKQYFVKYKNLAHVHNCWVPEGDINVTPGGPDLLSLFNKRNHTEKAIWKEEWTKPHRLLRKRLLIPPKLAGDFFSSSDIKYSYCTLEWLVKWRGLGYDHATWELETLPCLHTPEADQLKNNYENCREAAKQSSIPTKAKVKQSSFQKLQKLPDGCHPNFDNDHLFSINSLREFWYDSRGAVLVDDKEFVIKTVLFTMSVLPDVSQPILIVTTPASLSLWEVQFNTLAPFINVVVYDGGKDKLKLIQDLEFYESGSCIKLQVLLSHADAILEDLEPIARINWEAVIVDYFQKSTLQYLDQLKQLSTDFRMLLVSSPIQDNLPEYVKILGFLNPGVQENGNCVGNAEALVMSKVNFKRHIAYERQADSSKILEHWVPAYISQLQLETYCSILLSNSSVLQLKMKSDNSLTDIITSLSKCCDHPYLVDEFLQNSPVDNHNHAETIDTKVQACGKLLLLQKILKEISNKRLRVIILFHSGVAGGNSMGDILEGVVRDRFGPASYERVDNGAPFPRKHAAVSMFNDKTKGRFVFLIESRACRSSIELSSVNAIIIYNSDRNPLNDLEALQKIKIESQIKYPSIFRLYTPFTMEEKQLVLAKQGVLIDSYKDMPHSLGHSLISWGASFLFTRLDELQHGNYASKSFEGDANFMDKVFLEFLQKLARNVEDTEITISKANMSGEFYSRSITLIGENVVMPALDGDPSIFWLNLLDGKSPCWSNISKPPQSSHSMLQNIEEPTKVPAEEADEARRKRRKVDQITVPSSKHSSDNSHDDMLPKDCTALSPPLQQLDDTEQRKGMKKLTTPKNLHVQLKKELSKLIKVLQLPDNARIKAEQFFEYYLNNHLVLPEPVDILNAFNIALCWRAASLLNYKIDRRESVALAEKSFNCEYNEAIAGFIYKKLRNLKENPPNRAGETSIKGQPVSVEDTQLSLQGTSTILENGHMFQNKELDLHGNFTNGAPQEVSSVAEQMISEGWEPVQETRKECHVPNDEPPNMIVDKSIDLVDNVFSLRKNNILWKQQLEISGLVTYRQNNVIRLKEVCSLVLEHIRRSHIDEMSRSEKINLTTQWFTMLMYAFLEHMKLQHDKLEGLQSDTWSSEQQLKEKFHQVAKSGQLDLEFDRCIDLPESNFVMEEFIHLNEQNDEHRIAESSVSDCQQSSNDTLSMEITLVRNEVLSEPTSSQAMENERVETSVGSGGGPVSEAVDFPENSIHCSSDGIGVQRVGCSSSTIPATDDSTGQESPTSECRNAEPSMAAKQSTSPPTQQSLAISWHTPAEAEPSSLLGTVAACDLQPEVQPSTSKQDEPAQEEDETVGMVIAHDPQSEIQPPAQQSLAISWHTPAEAEPSSLLGTVAACDLHPEVQPSTSMQDEPAQEEDEHHVEDRTVGMVTAHDPQSEIQPPASVPAEQSTGLPAQQSLATSQYPSAEAKQPDNLGTQTACDLQPEVQPSTSVQDEPAEAEYEPEVPEVDDLSEAEDEPAEAERAGTLGAIAAQGMQPEMQSSTSTQDVPFEQTCMSDMPVLQSPTIHRSVEPSLDPHAGVESADMVTAHDLQSGILPSASVPMEQSTGPPAQQSLATSGHSPAAPDLQPEMQSSNSTQDVPFEQTFMSSMPVLQSLTIHRSVETSLDPHAGVESAGMVTDHDLQSEILPSASVPTEQSTSPPAQQSLATSGHSPAEAELADILGTEAACHLQSSQGEVQPLTTVQDQPAEEQACILGTITARSLQPETQPSTSTQSAPFDLVAMPVLQSPRLHHGVEPSLDPRTRAESMHTLGSLTTCDLQSELQPSASTQDRPAEAEGAVTSGSMAAQDLQPELEPSTAVQQVPLERISSEERGQIGFQPNMIPGPEQPTQHPPVTTLALNNPVVSDEPLKNELDRLMHCNNLLSKDHEHKKSLLQIEYNKEMEKIKRKYDSLLQKEDSAYTKTQKELADIYRKVYVNKIIAENFREVFTPSTAPGRSTSPVAEQPSVVEQPSESSSAAQTAASPVIPSSAIRAPVMSSSAIRAPGSHVRPSFVAQPSSPSWNVQQQAIRYGNSYGTTSSPSVPAHVPYGSYGSAGAQSRSVQPLPTLASNLYTAMSHVPPPHLPHGSYRSAGVQLRAPSPYLQQLRMPSQYAMHAAQQYLPASPAVTSLGQYAPVILGSRASTIPQGGAVLNSMDPSSAHQTMMPSASSSRPPRRASSLPPGRQESMANLLQSSGSNHIFMPAHQQSSYPNMVLGSTSGLPNAAPGSQQHAGVQIAGVNHNHSGYESASLTMHMPARFGLGSSSSPAGAVASPEVVCLSDDES
uniref:Uncharacterized protein n=1 Tax=Avena sativa TaxID=4498 RepID=A0ACD5Z8I4_AVESA